MFATALAALAFLLTFALTALTRRHARRLGLVDVPDARSSHAKPTARGGGVAIVFCFIILLIFLLVQDKVAPTQGAALLAGGMLVAGIGFLDDLREVPAVWRLVVHFVAVIWLLVWLKGFPSLHFGPVEIHAPWLVNLFGAVFLVWLLNLYNFMDGIDGLAAVETVTVVLGAAIVYWQHDLQAPLPMMLLCASVGGFLIWNWPPATIFLGDVGSGFLGFLMGAFIVVTEPEIGLWPWLILLGVFLVDATWTLLRRMLNREHWYKPHKTHAYQKAARRWGSHKPVTLAVALINIVWLLPIAWLASAHPHLGFYLAVLAFLPLFALAVWFDRREQV